jgi:hypothetical protein
MLKAGDGAVLVVGQDGDRIARAGPTKPCRTAVPMARRTPTALVLPQSVAVASRHWGAVGTCCRASQPGVIPPCSVQISAASRSFGLSALPEQFFHDDVRVQVAAGTANQGRAIMKLGRLSMSIIAAAMMLGSAGAVLAQSNVPMPTGSAGNSNTGPGARPPMGAATQPTTRPRRHHMRRTTRMRHRSGMIRSTAPIRTGSAGNSNTGPGARSR